MLWLIQSYQINTKLGIKKGNLTKKLKRSPDERHTHTWRLNWNILTITDVFLNQKSHLSGDLLISHLIDRDISIFYILFVCFKPELLFHLVNILLFQRDRKTISLRKHILSIIQEGNPVLSEIICSQTG